MKRRPILALAALAALAALLAGCGGSPPRSSGPAPDATGAVVQKARARTCLAGSRLPLVSRRVAYAAAVRAHADAYRRPGGKRLASFGPLNVNGVPTVFGVLDAVLGRRCHPTWYRVQLPMRPNGITGYVRARDVELSVVHTRILVDVSARQVTLYRDGRRVLHSVAAVGAPATPTPTGRFYVNQRLIPEDASGPYGPGAIGISAFSDVLTGWAQGGPVAIHGTNAPWSIGHAVSNGCIRLPNAVLLRMFRAAPAGTPVIIRA